MLFITNGELLIPVPDYRHLRGKRDINNNSAEIETRLYNLTGRGPNRRLSTELVVLFLIN